MKKIAVVKEANSHVSINVQPLTASLSLGSWFLPLRWYHLMQDRCTWDLTWVHLYLRMPMSCQEELFQEQVSTARCTSMPDRIPSLSEGM